MESRRFFRKGKNATIYLPQLFYLSEIRIVPALLYISCILARTLVDTTTGILLTRQYNIASCHPRLIMSYVWVSVIGRHNTSETKKDSSVRGMTKLRYLIAVLIVSQLNPLKKRFMKILASPPMELPLENAVLARTRGTKPIRCAAAQLRIIHSLRSRGLNPFYGL